MTLPDPAPEDLTIPPSGLASHTMRMEQFNRAYIQAVVSAAGYTICKPEIDDDSIDIMIKSRAKHGPRKAPQVDAQLKSTASVIVRNNNIKFDLSIKNYNDLRDTDVSNPRILVLMILPAETSDWVVCNEDHIEMRKRAYWVSLFGKPSVSSTTTTRVDVPLSNVLNVSSLHEIINKVGRQIQL